MANKMSKKTRKRKYGSRWATWKRNQRAKSAGRGKVRHHVGGKVRVISRKAHAAIHKKNGTAGGRPKGKGRKKRGKQNRKNR